MSIFVDLWIYLILIRPLFCIYIFIQFWSIIEHLRSWRRDVNIRLLWVWLGGMRYIFFNFLAFVRAKVGIWVPLLNTQCLENLLVRTECLNTRSPGSLCLPCYVRKKKRVQIPLWSNFCRHIFILRINLLDFWSAVVLLIAKEYNLQLTQGNWSDALHFNFHWILQVTKNE